YHERITAIAYDKCRVILDAAAITKIKVVDQACREMILQIFSIGLVNRLDHVNAFDELRKIIFDLCTLKHVDLCKRGRDSFYFLPVLIRGHQICTADRFAIFVNGCERGAALVDQRLSIRRQNQELRGIFLFIERLDLHTAVYFFAIYLYDANFKFSSVER